MVPSSSTTKSSWKLNMRSVCGNTCAITMGTSLRKGNDYRSVLKIPIKCQECGTTIVWLVGLLVRTRHNQSVQCWVFTLTKTKMLCNWIWFFFAMLYSIYVHFANAYLVSPLDIWGDWVPRKVSFKEANKRACVTW